MTVPPIPDRRKLADRRLEKSLEVAEAEAAKPLVTRRTNSPAEAKREVDRSRAEIEATIDAMKSKVVGQVDEVRQEIAETKYRLDVPNRLLDKVRAEPWKTLAIAAGVGLGLALLTAGGKRGYDMLTKDEIDEIRAWRKERREHLERVEKLLEKSAKRHARNAQPALRDRIRARLAAARDRR